MSTPLSYGSTPPMSIPASSVAIGIVTGGPRASEYIDALKATWLPTFPNVLIMGDTADESRQIEAVPSKYYCADPKRSSGVRVARSRCTQMRFLYVLMEMRLRFEDIQFYTLVDDDVWLSSELLRLLYPYDPAAIWMMGAPDRREMLRGSVLVFSRGLLQELTHERSLTRCASHWMFACTRAACCDGGHACGEKTRRRFAECDASLRHRCFGTGYPTFPSPASFAACATELEREENKTRERHRCQYASAVPEHGGSMFVAPSANEQQGDDHWLSFCTVYAAGGHLIPQPCFHFDGEKAGSDGDLELGYETSRCAGGQWISNHHLSPERIRQRHKLEQARLQKAQKVEKAKEEASWAAAYKTPSFSGKTSARSRPHHFGGIRAWLSGQGSAVG